MHSAANSAGSRSAGTGLSSVGMVMYGANVLRRIKAGTVGSLSVVVELRWSGSSGQAAMWAAPFWLASHTRSAAVVVVTLRSSGSLVARTVVTSPLSIV